MSDERRLAHAKSQRALRIRQLLQRADRWEQQGLIKAAELCRAKADRRQRAFDADIEAGRYD